MDQAAEAKPDTRTCTCHPDDAPIPCPRKFATHYCWRAAVYEQTRGMIVDLKNRDTSVFERHLLDYLKRVERALDGSF
jgi:hypothetical protein